MVEWSDDLKTRFKDLNNRYLIALFEKHLYPLYAMGFHSESHLPETRDIPLKLIFIGPFEIEVSRNYRCDTFMSIYPISPNTVKKTEFCLHQLVFTFSDKKENLLPIFHNIGCYYPEYEENISIIAERFFHYYDQICYYMKEENLPTLQTMLSNDEIDFYIAIGFYSPDNKR